MTITEKLKRIVLPSLLVIGIGILEIKYPHAMKGLDDGYTGRGVAGIILLLFELFIMLTWGKIGGVVAILLGMLAIVICFLPNKEQAPESENNKNSSTVLLSSESENNKNSPTALLSSPAFRIGKAYVQQRLRNQ